MSTYPCYISSHFYFTHNVYTVIADTIRANSYSLPITLIDFMKFDDCTGVDIRDMAHVQRLSRILYPCNPIDPSSLTDTRDTLQPLCSPSYMSSRGYSDSVIPTPA